MIFKKVIKEEYMVTHLRPFTTIHNSFTFYLQPPFTIHLQPSITLSINSGNCISMKVPAVYTLAFQHLPHYHR